MQEIMNNHSPVFFCHLWQKKLSNLLYLLLFVAKNNKQISLECQ